MGQNQHPIREILPNIKTICMKIPATGNMTENLYPWRAMPNTVLSPFRDGFC
jgi:hypothetical protein